MGMGFILCYLPLVDTLATSAGISAAGRNDTVPGREIFVTWQATLHGAGSGGCPDDGLKLAIAP